ncbi:MAG: radical SAM protein, partial [Halobacteriaceae archaeon]
GEPTIRNDLVDIVSLINEYVDHVQLNTHSALLADDPDRAMAIDEAGVDTVYTSFDGLTPETNPKNHWETPVAIRTYRETDMAVVLVPTIIGGHNDDQLGDIIRFAAANNDTIRGVDFQPVSLVGRMPAQERHAKRVTIPDAIQGIADQTDGQIPPKAWYPIPRVLPVTEFSELWQGTRLYELSNHFACGMATYVYVDGDDLVPITDFFDVDPFLSALEELADEVGVVPGVSGGALWRG